MSKRKFRFMLIAGICVGMLLSYSYGVATLQYKVFPYAQLTMIKRALINSSGTTYSDYYFYSDYYLLRKSFFEQYGQKADVVMIGDSITDGAEWEDLFPTLRIANRGITGDTSYGILNRMDSIYSTEARKAFLMFGINDILAGTPVEKVFANYKSIVMGLKERGICPYIQSCIFVGNSIENINSNIISLNGHLKKLAMDESIVFIDLNSVLAKNGRLDTMFSSSDGVHLNVDGYAVWYDIIKPYMQ